LVQALCSHLLDFSISPTFFLIKSKRSYDTVVLVLPDDQVEPVKVSMSKCILKNLYIFLGDIGCVFSCSNCPDCTRVAILPFKDTLEGLSGDLVDIVLKLYFASTSCAIRKLETFSSSSGLRAVEFQITECEPGEYCSVTLSTEIHLEGEPLQRKDDGKADIGSDNIGGCLHKLGLLRELI
jgi:transitional endoplasmic reticulum ATPase